MATASIMQRSSMCSSSLMLRLFSYISMLLSSSRMGVVLVVTQLSLDSWQALWLCSMNFSLKRETAQQFMAWRQYYWQLAGRPRTLPVSVSIIQQKLPMYQTPLTKRNWLGGRLSARWSLLMKKRLLWASERKRRWSCYCSIFCGGDALCRIMLKGSAMILQLLMRVMPSIGRWVLLKQPSNHCCNSMALSLKWGAVRSSSSWVLSRLLWTRSSPSLSSRQYIFSMELRYLVSSLIQFQTLRENWSSSTSCPMALQISSSCRVLPKRQTEQ